MLRLSLALILTLSISCTKNVVEEIGQSPINKVTIFETYLKDTTALNGFSLFLQDTLQLPVEWEPFDLFGDKVVYDAAFFLGNTTFELVALYSGDSAMTEKARFNRIIFGTEDIEELSKSLIQSGFQHEPPSDFNIVSEGSQLAMGKQTTLDTLSKNSNVYVSFWQYLPAGLGFAERPVKATSVAELNRKLNLELEPNPLGIIELEEVHLSMTQEAIDRWQKLLKIGEEESWKLAKGPTISFTPTSLNVGVDWISIRVKDLDKAEDFLTARNLISTPTHEKKVSIDQSRVYGLQIFLEE